MSAVGAKIAINGSRPPFVRDGDWVRATMTTCSFGDVEGPADSILWAGALAIRLKSDHPYYLVAQHPGMVMHTGETRPGDFDAGKPWLSREDGLRTAAEPCWKHTGKYYDCIGYHPLPASPSVAVGAFSYTDAFYEIAEMLDLNARPISPKMVWEEIMRPMLAQFIAEHDAQHETPPFDEASDLLARIYDLSKMDYCAKHIREGNAGKCDTAAIQLIRAHLAKVREERA
jgi:hypothetical protein